MPVETITVENGEVKIIDQTRLPTECKIITIQSIEQMWEAIKMLRIRGAPAIGIAAAFGVYLGMKDSSAIDFDDFWVDLKKSTDYLAGSRPTAVNLFWALDRVTNAVWENRRLSIAELKQLIRDSAQQILREDAEICRQIGEAGLELINDGDGLLTHCNAGGLATAKYGTALSPMFLATERGMRIHVYADETRPLLQGARLTAWELRQAGVPVTLICDNMAASVMKKGWVHAVIVGTDRVAANGDVANKIGTYGVALLAKAHGIPFYVAVPASTIDLSLASGDLIPIEERNPEEITHGFGKQTAPDGIDVYNPAFDITPHNLVTAFITEKGLVHPPYEENLNKLLEGRGQGVGAGE